MTFFRLMFSLFSSTLILAQSPVKYTISFENAAHHEGEVSITFPQLTDDPLLVSMSRSSPGRYALHEFAKNVYNVRAFNGAGVALTLERPNPHQWEITGHDGTVKLQYTIFGDQCDGTYLAIDNTHAHMNMPATFMWADALKDRPIEIHFQKPVRYWKIATQLFPTEQPDVFTAPNLAYFMDSPTEISAFQLREWTHNDGQREQRYRLAVHHQGTAKELDTYTEMTKAVVEESIAIFGEAPVFETGTYTFIADYLPGADGDGMEHRNSTILTDVDSLRTHSKIHLWTVAHEFLHVWNVERIRPKSLEPFDFSRANMSAELWFAEGFTSYYDYLILQRAAIIDIDKYAREAGKLLNRIINSPGHRYFGPAGMSQRAPFSDAAVSVDEKNFSNTFISYYAYGAAIGLALDLEIRRRFPGKSLDDFMRATWESFGRTEQPYTNDDLQKLLGTVTGDAAFADDFFQKYVHGSELPDYAAQLKSAGLLLRLKEKDAPWIGRIDASFKKGKATLNRRTLVGTPLYEAGLDKNDVLLTFGGDSLKSKKAFRKQLEKHKPGAAVPITFEKNGIKKTGELVIGKNPQLELVTYEFAGLAVNEEIKKFRENWLGQKSTFDTDNLKQYCPKCRRAFPMANNHCRFDGKKLVIALKEK